MLERTLNEEQYDILRNCGEFYQSIIEYNPDAIFFYDCESHFLSANPAAIQLLGYTVEELQMHSANFLVAPAYREKRKQYFQQVLQGTPQEFEEVIMAKNGQQVEVSMKYLPTYIDGNIIGIHAIARDITMKRSMERELKAITERYQSLFDYTTDAVSITDLNRCVINVNQAFEQLFGFRRDDLIGNQSPIVPTELLLEQAGFRYTLLAGGTITGIETKRKCKDGKLLDVSLTYSTIRDDHGEIIAFSGIYRNITNRKRMEAALIEAEAKYRALVEKSQVGVYIVQKERFAYVNPRFAEIAGYTTEEIIGKSPLKFCISQDREKLIYHIRRKDEGGGARYQIRGVKKDKSTVWVEVLGNHIPYNGQPAMIGTIVDISDLKQTEEVLRKSDKLNIVGELAAGVAHELRNPLASIRGFIQLLQHGADIGQYAGVMLSEIDRINTIASEFLMLAKPQIVHYQFKDIRFILKSVISLINTQAIMNDIEIIEFLSDEVPMIKCEENHLKQVFINILKNSIDAMPGGGKIFIELFHSLNHEELIHIRIIDQGYGIPKDRLHKLGEPFYTTKEKGTGLGLMISYKIIEDHQGKIIIDSEENKGTTVEIMLPTALEITPQKLC
ncbi:MAG TPA: PAS domain S-box protein [Bacillota bacterium]|nr:PAS domain S-box protein [Bacillota bacterium]